MRLEPWEVSDQEKSHNKELDICILKNLRDILVNRDLKKDISIFAGNYFKDATEAAEFICEKELKSGAFIFSQEEAEKKEIVIYSVGSSGRGTYLPGCADTDIDIVVNEELGEYKHLIADTILGSVPAANPLGRKDSDFDAQPRLAYTYRKERRVDLSIRPKYDVRTLEYILSIGNWSEDMKKEIRKSKHFFKAKGVYHRSNHGLNGITVERMILKYGNLKNVCEQILQAGLPKSHKGPANTKDVIPLSENGFEIKFPDDKGRGVMNWWIGQNPKMWQRIVRSAQNYSTYEKVPRKDFCIKAFEKEYEQKLGWNIFTVDTKMKHVKDIERIIFEKSKEYFEKNSKRVEDFDLYSWGSELWVAIKPNRRKDKQTSDELLEENIKLFRNNLFFEINRFMEYRDSEDFVIKPRRQLGNHGHKQTGGKYVLMVANPRYFQIMDEILLSDKNKNKDDGLCEIKQISHNVKRYIFNDDFSFDLIASGGQNNAMKCAEIAISFGAEYIINAGFVGSLDDRLGPGSVVISGEFSRLDKKGNRMGTEPSSFYIAPLPTKITSSPLIINALTALADDAKIEWDIAKMATLHIYYEDMDLIRRIQKEGFANIIDEEATNVSAVAGFRSGKLKTEEHGRIHAGGVYFVSDVYLRGGGHFDRRADRSIKDQRSKDVVILGMGALRKLYEKNLGADTDSNCNC